MNIVVMTKGEWQAFILVTELLRQMSSRDRLLVWDDESPADWVHQMNKLTRVANDPLCGNFGEHRNRVKNQFLEGEWILMLDADEFIQPDFLYAVGREMDVGERDALYFERRNTFWEDTGSIVPPIPDYSKPYRPDFQGRAFRNIPAIHYEGIIHEALHDYDWPAYLSGKPFTIIHHKEKVPPRYLNLIPK